MNDSEAMTANHFVYSTISFSEWTNSRDEEKSKEEKERRRETLSAFSEDLFVISMRFSSFVVAISFVICWSNSLSFSAELAYTLMHEMDVRQRRRERGEERERNLSHTILFAIFFICFCFI